MMKVYVITRENLDDFTTEIICIYSKKDKAKEMTDKLNSNAEENVEYRIQSFIVDSEETYD